MFKVYIIFHEHMCLHNFAKHALGLLQINRIYSVKLQIYQYQMCFIYLNSIFAYIIDCEALTFEYRGQLWRFMFH